MPALPLSILARKACIKNINFIGDLGEADYDLVRPILVKLQNPKHLWELEQKSPQICGHDAEIWREFCKRDIPNYDKDPVEPANPKSWYKCYLKLLKESQRAVDEDAKLLKATLDNIKNKQAQNTAKQVELSGVKLLAGTGKDLPQIRLPKNSSFFSKERARHIDPVLLKHEREKGDVRASRFHQQTAEKSTSKHSKLMAKLKKDTLASSRSVQQAKPGIIQAREMRLTKPSTATSMLAASRARSEMKEKESSRMVSDASKMLSAPASNNRKRVLDDLDDLEDSEEELPTIKVQGKRLRLSDTADQADSPEDRSSAIDARERRLLAAKNGSSRDTKDPAFSETLSSGKTLQPSPHKPTSTSTLSPTPQKRIVRDFSPPSSPIQRAGTRSPQMTAPSAAKKWPRASSNPMMIPIRRPRIT